MMTAFGIRLDVFSCVKFVREFTAILLLLLLL